MAWADFLSGNLELAAATGASIGYSSVAETEFESRGFEDGEIIELGVKHGLVDKSGAWYSYNGDRIGQGKENVRQFLKDNPDMANDIDRRIRAELGGEALVSGHASPDHYVLDRAGRTLSETLAGPSAVLGPEDRVALV